MPLLSRMRMRLTTALMLDMQAESAAQFASATAVISVTRRGTQPSMPGRDEVKRLVQTRTF